MLKTLPVDIQLHLMQFLSARDIAAVGEVSPVWKEISDNSEILRKIIRRDLTNEDEINNIILACYKEIPPSMNKYLEAKDQTDTSRATLVARVSETVKNVFRDYFGNYGKTILFGPGLYNGLVNFIMWECTEIGVSTIPDPRSVLSGARVGLMISFGDKKSEIHPLYPAAKQIRMRDPNISLLDSQGNLNGQAKRRAENATHVIFCLSDHIESSAKNFKELNLISTYARSDAKILVLYIVEKNNKEKENFLVLAEKIQSSIGESRRFKLMKISKWQQKIKGNMGIQAQDEKEIVHFDRNSLKSGFDWLYKDI